jgi:hypothetical protein
MARKKTTALSVDRSGRVKAVPSEGADVVLYEMIVDGAEVLVGAIECPALREGTPQLLYLHPEPIQSAGPVSILYDGDKKPWIGPIPSPSSLRLRFPLQDVDPCANILEMSCANISPAHWAKALAACKAGMPFILFCI